jgi:hypothetical protein
MTGVRTTWGLSEYVRRRVIDRLRADGIDPAPVPTVLETEDGRPITCDRGRVLLVEDPDVVRENAERTGV